MCAEADKQKHLFLSFFLSFFLFLLFSSLCQSTTVLLLLLFCPCGRWSCPTVAPRFLFSVFFLFFFSSDSVNDCQRCTDTRRRTSDLRSMRAILHRSLTLAVCADRPNQPLLHPVLTHTATTFTTPLLLSTQCIGAQTLMCHSTFSTTSTG